MLNSGIAPARTGSLLRRIWPLVGVLILILFPFGWLGEIWPPFGAVIGGMLGTVRAHAIGHALMFFTLGLLVLWIFPGLIDRIGWYTILMLLAGIGQEAFQLMYKQRPLVFDDFRDLVTDASGWLLALAIMLVWRRFVHRTGRVSIQSE